MGNGCLSKHPLKTGCLEFQVYMMSSLKKFRRNSRPYDLMNHHLCADLKLRNMTFTLRFPKLFSLICVAFTKQLQMPNVGSSPVGDITFQTTQITEVGTAGCPVVAVLGRGGAWAFHGGEKASKLVNFWPI